MSDLVLGIDPAPDRYYWAIYDGSCIVAAGKDYLPGMLYINGCILPTLAYAAIIIETPDPKRGNYSPVRSRAGAVMQTYGTAVKLATQLATCEIPVYTPSRETILLQLCKWTGFSGTKADDAVMDYLALLGYLKWEWRERWITIDDGDGKSHKEKRKYRYVTEPAYLRNVNHRDAAMASLFPWQHPDNQVYKVKGE